MEESKKEIFKKKLGKRIQELRIRQGITQVELGIRLGGRDKQAISRFENGKIDPKITTVLEIAEAFKISLIEFLDFDN